MRAIEKFKRYDCRPQDKSEKALQYNKITTSSKFIPKRREKKANERKNQEGRPRSFLNTILYDPKSRARKIYQ